MREPGARCGLFLERETRSRMVMSASLLIGEREEPIGSRYGFAAELAVKRSEGRALWYTK